MPKGPHKSLLEEFTRREVALHRIRGVKPTFLLGAHYVLTQDEFLDIMAIYTRANENNDIAYDFVIGFRTQYTRHNAFSIAYRYYTNIIEGLKLYDLPYVLDWWYRHPADTGIGPLIIGIRHCDIREMVLGLV